jgi:8-oxo-dGTP pyrophosphatase MutT (NUDIX family)
MTGMPDLGSALAPHLDADPRPEAAPGDRLAAVLALIVDEDPARLVLTERSAAMSRHPGEVSFPGGLAEPADADLAATALRETREEIGIDPIDVRVLGALAPVHTYVSGTLVTPFVGLVSVLPRLSINEREIASVHVPALVDLAGAEERRVLRGDDGEVWRGWWYVLPSVTVWGATGFMLHALLGLLRAEASWTLR